MKKCIILANGKPPAKKIIEYLKRAGYYTLVCADGGANFSYKMNLTPDYIIGDLDSVKPDVLKAFSRKSEVIQISRQNDTDVEKCLKFVIKNQYSHVVLTGVTGDRLDHTIGNLGIVIKFFNLIKLFIIAENSVLQPYTGYNVINTIAGETVSVYGLDTKTKITSSGLKYKLNNTILPFGEKESTSNVALNNQVTLDVKGGIIFVIRDYKIMRENGFLHVD